jgi:hypothetical protein
MISQLTVLILPLIGVRPYLDPGSGSFILQILIATLVGSLFLITGYWKKIKAFIKKTPPEGEDGDKE